MLTGCTAAYCSQICCLCILSNVEVKFPRQHYFASPLRSEACVAIPGLRCWRIGSSSVNMGCKATIVPVFAAEVTPAHMRGMVQQSLGSVQLRGLQVCYNVHTSEAVAEWYVCQTSTPKCCKMSRRSVSRLLNILRPFRTGLKMGPRLPRISERIEKTVWAMYGAKVFSDILGLCIFTLIRTPGQGRLTMRQISLLRVQSTINVFS